MWLMGRAAGDALDAKTNVVRFKRVDILNWTRATSKYSIVGGTV